MIKAIVFDLWETLGTKDVSLSGRFCERFGIPKTKEFMVKYERSVQMKRYEKKENLARDFLESFKIEINEDNITFMVKALEEGIKKAIMFEGIEELIEELSEKYSLGILSNTTCFESEVVKKWGIDGKFEAMVFSWEIGSIKPDKKNYEEICRKLRVKSGEVIFIDDTKENVEAAKKFGIKGIVFEGVEQLRKELPSFFD
jgi:HAD superfamily hydrolase (TIGR01509 family)